MNIAHIQERRGLLGLGRPLIKVLLAGLLAVNGFGAVLAQEADVPLDVQVPLFLKVLSFDRNLTSRSGGEIVIGILYQSKVRVSLNTMENFISTMDTCSRKDLRRISIRCVPIEVGAGMSVADSITKRKINTLYITPMRAVDLGAIVDLCKARQIPALTGVAEYFPEAAAVGIGLKGDRPEIVINLPLARAEGLDFTSQLLKLARVIY